MARFAWRAFTATRSPSNFIKSPGASTRKRRGSALPASLAGSETRICLARFRFIGLPKRKAYPVAIVAEARRRVVLPFEATRWPWCRGRERVRGPHAVGHPTRRAENCQSEGLKALPVRNSRREDRPGGLCGPDREQSRRDRLGPPANRESGAGRERRV